MHTYSFWLLILLSRHTPYVRKDYVLARHVQMSGTVRLSAEIQKAMLSWKLDYVLNIEVPPMFPRVPSECC